MQKIHSRYQTFVVSLLLVAAVLTVLSGCSSKSKLLNYPPNPGKTFGAPSSDQATVIFMRPKKLGYKVSAAVYDGDQFLSIVMYQTHYVHQVPPGERRFMIVSEAADFLDADLEAGKVYFAEVLPRMGVWRARFSLRALDASQAQQKSDVLNWLADSYEVQPNAEAHQWAVDNEASVQTKKEAYLPKWEARSDRPKIERGHGVSTF